MNIIVISNGNRAELLTQTLESLHANAADPASHHFTLVIDGYDEGIIVSDVFDYAMGFIDSLIINSNSQGASASRNIGAGSIPKYRRQEHVLFLDDDVFLLNGFDAALVNAAQILPDKTLLSPYGHPYNIEEHHENILFANFPLLISSVAAFMTWKAFDEIGYWLEPGGASGSEDFEFCSRARDCGYGFAVLNPHAAIHTGLTSSNGKEIVGYEELAAQNQKLLDLYDLNGKVVFG